MKRVRLGKTGLNVSRIGMGGIPLTRPPEDETIKMIQCALDLGITLIDTAYGYGAGKSEICIGKAIVDRRDQVILATKGGGDKDGTLKCIETSLKRLNTDYIDLWQFHGVNNNERWDQILRSGGGMEGAQEALEAGKIRHIGFSSHSREMALKLVASGHFETVQFPFNLISNEAVDELVPLARKHDVGFIAMKPFAGGRIKEANLAIKYLLQFDNVVPDPGIEKAEEIEEIVDIVNNKAWQLLPSELREIEDIRERVGTRFCRQCEYCIPCPEGVHIAGVMYLPILWELWPPDWYFSWGYVKQAVETGKNCIQCGICEKRCPYHLPIREMIVANLEFYNSVAQKKADV